MNKKRSPKKKRIPMATHAAHVDLEARVTALEKHHAAMEAYRRATADHIRAVHAERAAQRAAEDALLAAYPEHVQLMPVYNITENGTTTGSAGSQGFRVELAPLARKARQG